jgi:hypothetical protein
MMIRPGRQPSISRLSPPTKLNYPKKHLPAKQQDHKKGEITVFYVIRSYKIVDPNNNPYILTRLLF